MYHHHEYILQESTFLRNLRTLRHHADASTDEAYIWHVVQQDNINVWTKSGFLVFNDDFGHEFKPIGSTDDNEAQGHRFSLLRKR